MLNLAVTRVLSTIEMLDVAGQVAFCLANARGRHSGIRFGWITITIAMQGLTGS